MNKTLLIIGMCMLLLMSFASASLSTDFYDGWTFNSNTDSLASKTIFNSSISSSISCLLGNCYNYNGVNNYLYYKGINQSSFQNFTEYTVCAWFNASSYNPASVNSIFEMYRPAGLRLRLGKVSSFHCEADESCPYTEYTGIVLNNWMLACSVWNGTTIKLYINGSLKSTQPAVGWSTTDSNDNSGNGVNIGALKYKWNGFYNLLYFNGSIDDTYIWSKAKTDSDILLLYNNGLGLSYPFVSANFSMLANDYFNNNMIYNFSAIINGTTYYSNISTGILTTNINASKGYNFTINVSSKDYFNRSYYWNTSSSLSAKIYQSIINLSTTYSDWTIKNGSTILLNTSTYSGITYLTVGNYSNVSIISNSASFITQQLDGFYVNPLDNKTINFDVFPYANKIESITDYAQGVVKNYLNYSIDFNYSNSTTFYDVKVYFNNVHTYTFNNINDNVSVYLQLPTTYYNNVVIGFESVDSFGRVSNRVNDTLHVYGGNYTVSWFTETGQAIDLVGISSFSCGNSFSVSSTATPINYLVNCTPTFYSFIVNGSGVSSTISISSGTQNISVYISNPENEQYILKPIEIADLSGQEIQILRTGNIVYSDVQDELGKIYPYLIYGQRYDVAVNVSGIYKVVGSLIPTDTTPVIYYFYSFNVEKITSSFWQDIIINYGYSNSSIFLDYADALQNTNYVDLKMYYYASSTYNLVYDSLVTGQNNITFIHPLTAPEILVANNTDWKLVLTVNHQDLGSKQFIYFVRKTDKLVLTGIGRTIQIFIAFLIMLLLVGSFSVKLEDFGLIFCSIVFMLFQIIGIFTFTNVMVFGMGSLFFVIGLFSLLKKRGVLS